jgi:hypothetical protein
MRGQPFLRRPLPRTSRLSAARSGSGLPPSAAGGRTHRAGVGAPSWLASRRQRDRPEQGAENRCSRQANRVGFFDRQRALAARSRAAGGAPPSLRRLMPVGLRLLPECYGDWQDAGRSAAGPVHWPLWPAPFPPLVGGDGFADATGARAPSRAHVDSAIAIRLRSGLIPTSFLSPAANLSRLSSKRHRPHGRFP